MAIKIKAEKVWENEEQKVKITGFKMLPVEKIQNKRYVKGFPTCYAWNEESFLLFDTPRNGTVTAGKIHVGEIFSKEDFASVCKIVRKCGDRLHKLNGRKREEKRKNQWSGKISITV